MVHLVVLKVCIFTDLQLVNAFNGDGCVLSVYYLLVTVCERVVWYIVIKWDGSQFQVLYLNSGEMGIDSEDLYVQRALNQLLSSQ